VLSGLDRLTPLRGLAIGLLPQTRF